jgi:FdhD protein
MPPPASPSPAPLRRPTAPVRVLAVRDGQSFERPDRLAAEEPMEVRAGGPGQEPVSVAVTMRTPGHDFELAAGFLYTEGLVRSRDEIVSVNYCELPAEEQQYNVVTVRLARAFDLGTNARNFFATSSCGICGKASLDHVRVSCPSLPPGPVVAGSVIVSLPGRLREAQRIFEETGGLHAGGLFEPDGTPAAVREDVGRHNALDKLVGWALLGDELPLSRRMLLVSGRVSFEIVQKAAVAGIPLICAVSAPSSLAVAAADELGVTVAGFVRGGSFNLYSHPERVDLGS